MRLRFAPSLLAAFAVAGAAGLAACTGGPAGGDVALHVTPAASVADQAVRITVSGLTPGLPASLSDIPLEYFARALHWLRRQPQVDPAHLLTLGYLLRQ